MNKLLANFLLLICYGSLLLSQPTNALRIKRADSLANTTITATTTNNNNNNNLKANLTVSPLPLALAAGSVTAAVADKPQVKIVETTQAAVANEMVATAAAKATTAATIAEPDKKLVQLDEAQANELAGHMRRGKRRMSLVDELPKAAHHGHHHGGAGGGAGIAAPPFVYFNKMVSPDGKQELKEFQLLAPNVVIESVQHDMNYAPAGDLGGGVLLLNADGNLNGHIHGMGKPKHHHKHKSSLALPPFLFMLQQLLQPNLNVDLELPTQRNRLDGPLYQFVDSAVDNALRNNHEMFEHEIEIGDKDDKDKEREVNELKLELNKEDNKAKEPIEVATNRKDDELVVSCPIHHDHHANNNGEIVDDDVVLVNECHIV